MQKGNILIYLLIGILFIGGLGGAYYLGTKKFSIPPQPQHTISQTSQPTIVPSPTSTPTVSDKTTDWKTYTNSHIGFSFQYPYDLEITVEKDLGDGVDISFSNKEWVGVTRLGIYASRRGELEGTPSLEEMLSGGKYSVYKYSQIFKQNINGQPLYIFAETYEPFPGKLPPVGGPLYTLIAQGVINNITFYIFYPYEDIENSQLKNKDEKEFKSILSTLKIL